MTIIWTKPSGMEIETNDMAATITYCEGLGWKRAGDALTPAGELEVATEDYSFDPAPDVPVEDAA